MSKASKRLRRMGTSLEEEIRRASEAGEHARVLEELARLVQESKEVDPAYLFMGAKAYYALGDLDRAAQWVENTLMFDSGNVEARLLLVRICMKQARPDDGMAVLNQLLAKGLSSLSEAQQKEAKDIWLLYGEASYVKKFEHLSALETSASSPNSRQEETQDVKTLLRRLKEKIGVAGTEPAPSPVEPDAEPPSKAKTEAARAEASVQEEIRLVLAKDAARSEKIRILNAFAGASYLADDFASAKEYLLAALRLDEEDAATLRNMAFALIRLGETDTAEQLAARLPVVDFAVLDAIKR